jgi:hypothetical protein
MVSGRNMTDIALKMPVGQTDNNRSNDPFSKVISSCSFVVDNARDVAIDDNALSHFARTMPRNGKVAWQFSGRHHYTGEESLTLRYVLCIGAINFGSGYAHDLIRSVPNSTYYTIASLLKDAVTLDPEIVSSQRLIALTMKEVRELFGQAGNDNPRATELMAQFRLSLNELGHWLIDRYDDDLDAVIDDTRSTHTMLQSLLRMKRFEDVSLYDNKQIYYYKRAQLLIADLARVGREFGWWDTAGLERLTIFADNAVAHVLRQLGVLVYSDRLAARIDAGEYLEAGERAENEIRAASVIAGNILQKTLAAERKWSTILEIDHYLWDVSHEPEFRRPSMRRHMCRTIAY